MTYIYLSQTERYQIYALMKAGQNLKTIAQILGRHKSTVSREVLCNSGSRFYRLREACILRQQRAQASRNALQIDQRKNTLVAERLNLQRCPEQIVDWLPFRHKTIHHKSTLTRQAVAYFGINSAFRKRKVSTSRVGETVALRSLVDNPLPSVPLLFKDAPDWLLGGRIRDCCLQQTINRDARGVQKRVCCPLACRTQSL